MQNLRLHQFLYSHFNDKARWALDYKRLDCARQSYLPGPHLAALRRLSGQAQTPVLVVGADVIAGSAAIIDALELRFPDPPLYPHEAGERAAALAWQSRLDKDFGPAVRTVLFAVLIHEPDYLCAMFGSGKPWLKRVLYRATFPLARPLIAKGNAVDKAEYIDIAHEITRQGLDDIATAVSATGYLVGARFSVADLCAAALIAPLCDPSCRDMRRPEPRPPAFEQFLANWRGHAACAWAESMYARHRSH